MHQLSHTEQERRPFSFQFSVFSFPLSVFRYHLHFAPLTTSSLTLAPTGVDRWFRDPQGATFADATCDLSLPMLSNPRFN